MGLHNLNQISTLDAQSLIWTKWQFPEVPVHLEASIAALQTHLHGIAPLKQDCKDDFHWDPSGSTYSIKAGYQTLCNMEYPAPTWSLWNLVWRSEALPKIKFFIWTLLKGKILTSDNLKNEV